MNCYLSWNLKDMTNISAEKLQKNISQQASYIQLYRSELTKEAYKFNIGSLLRHICTERASFGTEPIQKRATDCLVVFLHAAAFQKVTYFAPTDAENPAVAKCARNLHRLMLENVKSTMRFIDYEVLQKHARGEIDTDELFSERRRIHEAVFPDDNLITISKNDGLNDEFLKLIDMETQKARVFVDFDVQRNTSISTELCQKLASVPRSEAALPDSRYGLIGSCKSSLATPFIKYGNSYYSFVTAYSLNEIAPIVDKFADSIPVVTEPEPAPEPEPIVEPVIESEPEPVSEPEPEPEAEPVEEESHAEEPEAVEEIVEEQPEQEEETPEDTEDVEPVEEEAEEIVEPENEPESESEEPEEVPEEPEEAPQDIEEEDDIPFDEPEETYYEPEMSEASEEEEDDDEPEIVQTEVEEPVLEQSPSEEDEDEEENPEDDPFEDDDDDLIEESPAEYSALVSPDAYDYLNQASKSDFKEDPMLEEQDHGAWYDDEDEDDELPPEDDEPDPYDGESLFSIMDDSEEDEEPVKEEPVEEPEPTSESPFIAEDEEEAPPAEPEPIVRFVEPTEPIAEEPQPEEEESETEEVTESEPEEEPQQEETSESEPEAEPEAESEEPEVEPEPEPEPEPQVKPAEDQTLPLLDQILRCAPSKNNPIVQYLTSCPFEQKKEIVRFIELARKAWLIDGKDKMFSIPDTTISVAIFSETQDPMLNIQRRENIGAVMFASQKDSWNSLELSYDGSGQFVKADYVRISRNSYTDWEWKIVEKLGTRLMERRAK